MLYTTVADGNALHLQGRFHASQATQDHGRVHVAQMADAKGAPCQRAQTACNRHLKPFARNCSQGFGINAGTD